MKIYNDTPKEILALLTALDFSQISEENKDLLLDRLEKVLVKFEKYIPLRTELGGSYDINIPGAPTRLGKIINRYHWVRIRFIHKTIAMPVIKAWFNNNLPTKRKI